MKNSVCYGIEKYLNLRVKFGYKYDRGFLDLRNLARYLKRHKSHTLKTAMVLEWLTTYSKASESAQAIRLRHVCDFASYWKTFDPKTEIPDRNMFSRRTWRSAPKIFTSSECKRLLLSCNRLGKLKSASDLTVTTYRTLFGLIMATGLRRNEIVKLKHHHVDLERGRISIELTKFRKSREIPIHQSVVSRLRRYSAQKNKVVPSPNNDSYFLIDGNRGVSGHGILTSFKLICDAAGISYRSTYNGVRVHDLRHTFAVRVIQRWLIEKRDIHEMMPLLSTYLGHNQPSDTYWYLTGTPQLMRLGLKLEAR